MSMLEIHADSLTTSNTAYHEFLLYYRNDARLVYGFVEGADDPVFYWGLIDQILIEGWSAKLIVAGDKRRVLELLSSMDWTRFPQKRVGFFVDRDLSDFVGDSLPVASNLYITDGYSMENSIISVATFDRTMEEVFSVRGMTPAETQRVHEVFQENLNSFQKAMMPLMAQILLWRRANERPCLENIKFRDWFRFQDGLVNLSEGFLADEARLRHAAESVRLTGATQEDIANAARELLEKTSPIRLVRGKYLLWFFVQCLLSIRESIGKFCARYATKPPKIRVAFGVENAVVLLGGRVRIPVSLRDFIELNYADYIRGLPG